MLGESFKVGGGAQHHLGIVGHGGCDGRGIAEALGQFQGMTCLRHLRLRPSVDRAIIAVFRKIDRSGLYLGEMAVNGGNTVQNGTVLRQ
jgi:hypothetical protein